MSDDPIPIEEEIKRSLRNLTLSVILLSIVMILVTVFATMYAFYDRANLRAEEARTSVALERVVLSLCSFREDVKQQLKTNKSFLLLTKGSVRVALQANIDSEQRTIDSLNILNCQGG